MSERSRWVDSLPVDWHRKLSPRAVQVMHEIGELIDGSDGQAIATIAELAKNLKCGRRAVERAMVELDRFVERDQPYPGGPNAYRIKQPRSRRSAAGPKETPNDASDSSDQKRPQETAMSAQRPIIHVMSSTTHHASNGTDDASSPPSPPPLKPSDSSPNSSVELTHHHQPRTHAKGTRPGGNHAGKRGGGGAIASGGAEEADERAALIVDLITLAKISADQAPRLVMKHGADCCRRNLALWLTHRNVGPGKLVTMIVADAAALTAKAKAIKQRTAAEHARQRPTGRQIIERAAASAGNDASGTDEATDHTAQGRRIVASLSDAELRALTAQIIESTGSAVRRRLLERRRESARTEPVWLASIALHTTTTPTK